MGSAALCRTLLVGRVMGACTHAVIGSALLVVIAFYLFLM